jgi:hypothetical protein
MRKVQENQEVLELKGLNQVFVYVVVSLLGENINTMKFSLFLTKFNAMKMYGGVEV